MQNLEVSRSKCGTPVDLCICMMGITYESTRREDKSELKTGHPYVVGNNSILI